MIKTLVIALAAVAIAAGAAAQTPTPTVTPTATATATPTVTPTPTSTPTPGGSYGRVAVTPAAPGLQRLTQPTAGARTLVWTAADPAWFNAVACTGNELLIVWNTDALAAGTVTLLGAPDSYGRSAQITAYSLAAGDIAVFGPLRTDAFRQADGKAWFQASAATIKFAVFRLP